MSETGQQLIVAATELDDVHADICNGELGAAADKLTSIIEASPIVKPRTLAEKAAPALLEACEAVADAIDVYEADESDRLTLADCIYDMHGGAIPGSVRAAIAAATEGKE